MLDSQLLNLVQAIGSVLIPLAVGLVLIYQNHILKTQLKTQDALINNMKAVNEILDINRIKEYGKIVEETSDKKINLEKQKFEERLQQEIDIAKKDKERYEQTILELNKVFFDVLIDVFISPKERRFFIEKRLPSNKETYLKLLDEFEKQYEGEIQSMMTPYLFNTRTSFRLKYHTNFFTKKSLFDHINPDDTQKPFS